MGALNQYFKKKWIKKLMEDYKMPQEKAKLVMDGIDKEATRDLKEAISKLSKNLKPSDNKNLIQDCSVKCPTNNKGKCMVDATKCEPYTLSKQS